MRLIIGMLRPPVFWRSDFFFCDSRTAKYDKFFHPRFGFIKVVLLTL